MFKVKRIKRILGTLPGQKLQTGPRTKTKSFSGRSHQHISTKGPPGATSKNQVVHLVLDINMSTSRVRAFSSLGGAKLQERWALWLDQIRLRSPSSEEPTTKPEPTPTAVRLRGNKHLLDGSSEKEKQKKTCRSHMAREHGLNCRIILPPTTSSTNTSRLCWHNCK